MYIRRGPLKGFVLLPFGSFDQYRGLGRRPFEPAIVEAELQDVDEMAGEETAVWKLYPSGWRQTAYRLYEEHAVRSSSHDDVQFLSNVDTAREIQSLIEPHIGAHEILACVMWEPGFMPSSEGGTLLHTLGYDAAYPGGDYYSAIFNGIFINPSPILRAEYHERLNAFGLFPNPHIIPQYISRFKEEAISEKDSEFAIFQLSTI